MLTPAPNGQRAAYVNARLIDPESGLDAPGALLTDGAVIADLGPRLFADAPPAGDVAIIDCGGRVLAPGLIDMRVFVGEPGARHKESYKSAGVAAAAGGVTTIVTMPATNPVVDDAPLVEFILRRARGNCVVNVAPMAALTKGLKGVEMTEFGFLKDAGAVGFTDARRAVADPVVMRRAMAYARAHDALIVQHAEEPRLADLGVMHEGERSMRLGLSGAPGCAETIVIERDLRLLALTGGRYHVSQISIAESLDAVIAGRARGLSVTAAVSAAHIALNVNDVVDYRTFTKLSPPLREEEDREAMVEGLARGDIDVLVSGHDPQDVESKRRPFALANYGAIGLETLLPAALLPWHDGRVDLCGALRPATLRPAELLGLPSGRLAAGAPADLMLFDPNESWMVDPDLLHSKSKNTPFEGRRFQGRATMTVVGGACVFDRALGSGALGFVERRLAELPPGE